MPRQVRPPETAHLELTQGDWLLVKKRLNAGETRKVMDRMVKTLRAGEKAEIDFMQSGGRSQAIEYLLDWGTFTDAAGNPMIIRDKSPDEVGGILDHLNPDDFKEVTDAVSAHAAAMEADFEKEKNGQDGASASSAISPSAD